MISLRVSAIPPRLRRWASVGLALVLLALIGWAIYRQRDAFSAAVSRLTWSDLLGAFALGGAALLANAMSWRAVLIAVGVRLPLAPALRVFGVSQLGKYLPGSVWPVLAQIELLRARGASRLHTGTASLVAMVVGVASSAGVGAALVVAIDERSRTSYWYVIVVAVAGVAVLAPPVLSRLLTLVERMFHRTFQPLTISWGGMGTALSWSVVMWILFGLHMWVLGRGLGAEALSPVRATGAFALAWVVGFLVVLAPAGVGVREAVLIVVLSPVMSEADALALAVVSRVLLTIVDGLAGGAGAMFGRRASRAVRS